MPSYKLIYFNIKGRAEIPRLIFAAAGQEYEDERIDFKEWPQRKTEMPFGQVPVLMIDGKPLTQSGAITRYLARKFDLCGSSPEEDAYIDMLMTTVDEVLGKTPFSEKDEEKKARLMKEVFEEHICPTFAKFEKKFGESGNTFYIGQKFTYADIAIMAWMTSLGTFYKGFPAKYPKLEALSKKVENMPKIKAWLEKRPVTQF